MFTGETSKHPELDPLGIGFDRILKFARVEKIFDKNIGGANLHPPAVRRLTLGRTALVDNANAQEGRIPTPSDLRHLACYRR